MKTLPCILVVLAGAWSAHAQSTFEAMLGYAPSAPGGVSQIYSPIFADINGPVGWTFQPTIDMEVTALGAFDSVVPSRGNLEVGLWDSTGILLASQAISTKSTAVGESFYQSISSVLLTAGQTYFIAAFSSSGPLQTIAVAPEVAPNGYAMMSPEIQLGLIAYSSGAGFSFPGTTDGEPGNAIIGPNFEFQPVPEPSSGLLFVTGIAGLHLLRRSSARNS